MSAAEHMQMSGTRKAAILISLLGDESAAMILRNLPDQDLQRVTDEVAALPAVPFEITIEVLEEFQQLLTAQDFIAVGGQDVAARLLNKAFGENGARSMVERLTQADEMSLLRVDSLSKADPNKLARFLIGEHSQTKALILGHLDAKQASALLMKLEPEVRADCVRRLANLGQFSPEIAAKVSSVLNRRLRAVGNQVKRNESGFRDAAELMNRLDGCCSRNTRQH